MMRNKEGNDGKGWARDEVKWEGRFLCDERKDWTCDCDIYH